MQVIQVCACQTGIADADRYNVLNNAFRVQRTGIRAWTDGEHSQHI